MTDPIADFLTRIRNGIHASHTTVDIPASKLKKEMARILAEQGYITSYEVEAPTPDHPGEIIRVAAANGVRKVQGGMGTSIVSTSHGVMTGHQAREQGVGGEVVAEVW